MKLNGTPRHYMPLPQNQSDDDENVCSKDEKSNKVCFKDPFDKSTVIDSRVKFRTKKDGDSKNAPMSALRLTAFIASLVLCAAFIIIFVWLVPCHAPEDFPRIGSSTQKWTTILHNISFTTSLTGVYLSKTPVVIFGYSSLTTDGSSVAGLFALQDSGAQLWHLPLHAVPQHLVCSIDANDDGVPECLVTGEKGLMTLVDVRKGSNLWYLHSHNGVPAADSVSMPAVLSDCDEDGVPDIVVSYAVDSNRTSAYVAVISGGTGKIIGSLIHLHYCASPLLEQFSWKWQNKTDLLFFCVDYNETGNLWYLSSTNICDVALSKAKSVKAKKVYKSSHFFKDVTFQALTPSDNGSLVVVVGGTTVLLLERFGVEIFKLKWKVHLRGVFNVRALTMGQYVGNENEQVVIVRSDIFGSEIAGLNMSNGREVWSIRQENGTITSVVSLPKLFGSKDGLLLKIVQRNGFGRVVINANDSYDNREQAAFFDDGDIIEHFEENYVLVQYGQTAVIRTLSTQHCLSICEETSCQPDVYTSQTTVVVSTVEKNTALSIMTVSSSLVIPNSSENKLEMETAAKHFYIGLLSFPSCMDS